MAVSGSRMEYQDPDIREMREYVAARRAMSQEAYDQWAQGSSPYRTDGYAATSSGADSLPALEISSGEQTSTQTGSQIDSTSTPYSTDTVSMSGSSTRSELDATSRSMDRTGSAADSRGSLLDSESVIDRIAASRNALATVDQSQVQSGLQQGVFSGAPFGVYDRPQDIVNDIRWLDRQIPRDGTLATEDRRTALLIATASARAQLQTDDPARQQELAYDYLFALRQGITKYQDRLPQDIAGRRGDPDIANAEHFFENSRFVTNNALQIGDLRIPVPSLISAYGMVSADLIYSWGKRSGILSGSSQASSYQTGWELAGTISGLGGGYVAPESGGDDVDRIVIIGDRLSN